MKARTRFAPSPTGYMHIGNLRTALYEKLTHFRGSILITMNTIQYKTVSLSQQIGNKRR